MNKVINVETLRIYREAVEKLEKQKIDFDKKQLLDNPELCKEIINLIDYFKNEE
ncbi:hypothetical protein NBE98_12965 [Clostridium swellfunianum]|uniref:hypothetical protein n=1 Tax=Clostridium swellfunianum TaxID=1367462 RepID=UPI00202DFAD1|nr:hypothetical protein [Clostridium swellfunianum]MCM0649283.1 hypothetical protein [Clostridium swellfunianum]